MAGFLRRLRNPNRKPEVAMPDEENAASDSKGKINQDALSWEVSRIDMIEKSEHRAWQVAFYAGLLCVLSWVGIVLMLPLKETQPFLVRVDNNTGYTDVMTVLKEVPVGYNETLDKYWISRFVKARESYDWYALKKDYAEVSLLSDKVVRESYTRQFEGEKAIHSQKRDRERTTVTLHSVTINGNGIATARFTRRDISTTQGAESLIGSTRWVATLQYEYSNPSKLSAEARLVNPLGFVVRAYRIDPEMARPAPITAEEEFTEQDDGSKK